MSFFFMLHKASCHFVTSWVKNALTHLDEIKSTCTLKNTFVNLIFVILGHKCPIPVAERGLGSGFALVFFGQVKWDEGGML